jgi:hypothetical protein
MLSWSVGLPVIQDHADELEREVPLPDLTQGNGSQGCCNNDHKSGNLEQ